MYTSCDVAYHDDLRALQGTVCGWRVCAKLSMTCLLLMGSTFPPWKQNRAKQRKQQNKIIFNVESLYFFNKLTSPNFYDTEIKHHILIRQRNLPIWCTFAQGGNTVRSNMAITPDKKKFL